MEPSGLAAGEVDQYRGRLATMWFSRFVTDRSGQDLAEYALLISLITLALIAAVTLIGTQIAGMFTAVAGMF